MREIIAFYLPQYHPIPENDTWWGKGFTDWRNVVRARPVFSGHLQPRLPADLGFYDLRAPEARAAQAELARSHGVTAFCYYHYWFGGRQLLERPFEDVLASGEPDFPFLLCWANENWTRRWDGRDQEILIAQNHVDDDREHFRVLASALANPRYLRLNGRPLVLVYRTELLPDPARTADIWRDEACRLGLGEICLGRVESLSWDVDPRTIGFDVAIEFAPRWNAVSSRQFGSGFRGALRRRRVIRDGYTKNNVYAYSDLVDAMLRRRPPDYPLFRCVCPSWDNTPRRRIGATIFHGAKPEAFERWVTRIAQNGKTYEGTPAPIFINSWNEWAEGAQLEPCSVFGRGFLEALRRGLSSDRPRSELMP